MSRLPSKVRRARRNYPCMTRTVDCTGVKQGERHLVHVLTPNDSDIGNNGWWRGRECASCAARYGRPIPEAVSA